MFGHKMIEPSMLRRATRDSILDKKQPVVIGSQRPRGGLLGLLPELSRDALALFSRCTVEYGDFVPMRLGLTQAVLLGHPELVEEVLVSRSQDFCKNLGTRRLRSALGDRLLVSEGESWLRQRRLMQSARKCSRSCRPAMTRRPWR
jgi:cytochrome P450